MDFNSIYSCFEECSQEAKDLYLDDHIPVVEVPPSPLEFYRNWIAPNKPVLIKGIADDWTALKKWNIPYLRNKIGNTEVTVTVTPNGYADAVYKGKFVMPEERKMKFNEFLNIIENPDPAKGVFYVQKQNSNLTDEFQLLMDDVELDIPIMSEALGRRPDAVNFWMGESQAVTSMHKDHYENLYTVIRGKKTFILIPPTDQPFIPYEEYQAAIYTQNENGQFDVIDDTQTGTVPWIAIDPMYPDMEAYPSYSKAHPISVTVNEGETLYLPSLWFHHVQQSHGCIAVNHWYDMDYDLKYCYYKLTESICSKLRYNKQQSKEYKSLTS